MKGVLLVNLGSPKTPTAKDVKPYLDEFLMDERVMDVPLWLRNIIVRGIILNTRPKRSAEAYRKIWWDEGSPLIVISERFAAKVGSEIRLPVELAMRYGSMDIGSGLARLADQGVDEVLLVPLYPHYAMSSYETVVVKVMEERRKGFPNMHITTLPPFYKDPDYITVLSERIREGLEDFGYDQLLFSYHGIPERQIYKSDPTRYHCRLDSQCCGTNSVAHNTCYRHQCFATTELVVSRLGIPPGKFGSSFQSRLTRDPWLTPFTDKQLEHLAVSGVKRLAVVTPAFVSDCLETLEEIAMEGEHQFLQAGGEAFRHIPCLNDWGPWVDLMAKWIDRWAESGELPG